jgi:hypothetical protein
VSARRSKADTVAPSHVLGTPAPAPAPGQGTQQVQRDLALVTSVLATWEQMLAKQPEQIEAVQAGLTTILTRAQRLLEQLDSL